jgi:hypothetical protein
LRGLRRLTVHHRDAENRERFSRLRENLVSFVLKPSKFLCRAAAGIACLAYDGEEKDELCAPDSGCRGDRAGLGLAAAPNAAATLLQFSYVETGSGAIHFTFDQDSNPTPLAFVSGNYTYVPVTNWTSNIGTASSIAWYNISAEGMFSTLTPTSYVVEGPQVYTGTEANPVFTTGVFDGVDKTNGLDGVLTITTAAVPAPLIGHGLLAVLAVGGLLSGAKLFERRSRQRLRTT